VNGLNRTGVRREKREKRAKRAKREKRDKQHDPFT